MNLSHSEMSESGEGVRGEGVRREDVTGVGVGEGVDIAVRLWAETREIECQ